MGATRNNESSTTEPPPRADSSLSHVERLNAFYWYQNFAIDSVVVKTQILFMLHEPFLDYGAKACQEIPVRNATLRISAS